MDIEKLKKLKRFTKIGEIEKEFLFQTYHWIRTVKEGIFCLKNNINNIPLCQYKNCTNKVVFREVGSKGYTKGCCKSHNSKLTNLERYGCENVKQSKEIKEKAMNTYNSKSDEEKKEIQKKKEAGMLKKYGVTNCSYAQEIKDKISVKNKANAGTRMLKLKENNQKKYGIDNVFQLKEVKEKSKLSILKKYGVENPSQSEEIKQKKEETCFNHFGVRNPQQNDAIYEKTNRYRWKNYTMPSGNVVKVQGYENFALDLLLKIYNESELVIKRCDIPKVWYKKPNSNKLHQYTTDIFIPSENTFIEVKSQYTYDKYLEINLLKEAASKRDGYSFEFMILNGQGEII